MRKYNIILSAWKKFVRRNHVPVLPDSKMYHFTGDFSITTRKTEFPIFLRNIRNSYLKYNYKKN